MFFRKVLVFSTLLASLLILPSLVFSAGTTPEGRATTSPDGCWVLDGVKGCVYSNEKNDNKATGSNHLGEGIQVVKYPGDRYCVRPPADHIASGLTLNQSVFLAGKDKTCYDLNADIDVWRIDFGLVFIGTPTPAPAVHNGPKPIAIMGTGDDGCWALGDLGGCVYINDNNFWNKADGSNHVDLGLGFAVEVYANDMYCVRVPEGYIVNGSNVNQGAFIPGGGCHKYSNTDWRVDFGVAFVGVPTPQATPTPKVLDGTNAEGCFYTGSLKGCVYYDLRGEKIATGGNHAGAGIGVEVLGNEYCLVAPDGFVVTGYNLNQHVYVPMTGGRCYTHNNEDVYRLDFALGVDPNITATPQPTSTSVAPTATPIPATATAIAENQGKVEVVSVTKKDTCSWEVHIKVSNFNPNSQLAERTTGTETNCAGETYDVIITAEIGQFISTAANGTAEWIQTVSEYGTYTATYTDAAGRTGTITYTVAP